MSEVHKKYMQLAIKEAEKALVDGVLPVGAIVVGDGKVVGRGRRRAGDHPYLDHAEIGAMREALQTASNSTEGPMLTLYSTLEPCLMCFATALNTRRIGNIIYAVEDPYGGGTSLPQSVLTPRYKEWYPKAQGGVMREEVIKLLRKFFMATNDPYWANPENPLRKLAENR